MVRITLALVLFATLLAGVAPAALVFTVSSPATETAPTNRVDWTAGVTGQGYAIENEVDFEALTDGAFTSSLFYTGVSLNAAGSNALLETNAGPGETGSAFQNPGEGVHTSSRYLRMTDSESLTISFSDPVVAVGLDTFDKFSGSTFSIEIFSGQNASGTLLGQVTGIGGGGGFQNYQQNRTLFLGAYTDDMSQFSSMRLTFSSNSGDDIGIDNIVYAVPEPSGLALSGLALLGLTLRRRRK